MKITKPSLRGSLRSGLAHLSTKKSDVVSHLHQEDCFTCARNDVKTENGNVFFYILLAVALFAALTYAVSNNKDGNINIYDEEQAKIAAQEIIEYGNTVANVVQKLRLRGCSDTEISFENDIISGYANGTNTACQIFHADGGNINVPAFNQNIFDSNAPIINEISFNGENNINGLASSNAELIAFISRLNQNICNRINQLLNNTDSYSDAGGLDVGDNTHNFIGTYNSTPETLCDGTADNTYAGCCLEAGTNCNGDACYHFYQVLIPR